MARYGTLPPKPDEADGPQAVASSDQMAMVRRCPTGRVSPEEGLDVRDTPHPRDLERMRANAHSVLATGTSGDTVYVLEFAGDGDSTAFGQTGLTDEPDWCTGLAVAPDGVDLTTDEPEPGWRRDPEHLKFYAELTALSERWHRENVSFDGGPFGDRQEREQELSALYQRWAHLPGLKAVGVAAKR